MRAPRSAFLQRLLRCGGIAAVAAAIAIAMAGCGGSSSASARNAPAHLLSQAVGPGASRIRSGDLSLTLSIDLDGLRSLGGKPLSLVLSGPFTTSPSGSTEFDFDATLTVSGQTVPLAIVSTGTALYLELGGTYYSIPSSTTGGLLGSAATGSSGVSGGILASLGIDPRGWLTDPKMLGTATVGGVTTEHLSAQIDVASLLGDLGKAMSRLGSTGLSGSTGLAGALSGGEAGEIASAVSSADVDLYIGKADHLVHELKLALAFSVPPAARSSLGVTSGSFTLDAQLTNLGAPETITPPASSQPLSSLLGGGGLASLSL